MQCRRSKHQKQISSEKMVNFTTTMSLYHYMNVSIFSHSLKQLKFLVSKLPTMILNPTKNFHRNQISILKMTLLRHVTDHVVLTSLLF